MNIGAIAPTIMPFLYDKETTREICRSCGENYEDFYFADTSGVCEDCGVNSGHIGFTNEPKGKPEEAAQKYPFHISAERGGDYRIVSSFEVEAKDKDEAEEKAQEELQDFIDNLNVQAE